MISFCVHLDQVVGASLKLQWLMGTWSSKVLGVGGSVSSFAVCLFSKPYYFVVVVAII